MNWKLLVPLGLTGAIPPLVALGFALTDVAIVALLWTALAALVWVPLVLRAKEPRPFAALLVVGVVAGVAAGIVDTVALGDPMLFVMALTIGAVWGALFGAIAVAITRMRRGRGAASA